MCTWFSVSWRRFRYDKKCLFSCIYNSQITISPTSLFSANFNGNRVKNHPKPWTCPLKELSFGGWTSRQLRGGQTNIICVKCFVIERALDFIRILEEDFPRQCYWHCFHELFPEFKYDIIDRILELLSFVYMSCINYCCQCLFFNLDSLCETVWFS